jgi:hypothetical protein
MATPGCSATPMRVSVRSLSAFPLVLAIGVMTAAAQSGPQAGDTASLSALHILLRMERTYKTCHSYRDTGHVESLSLTDGGRYGSDRPFQTAFVRPGKFRFQFTDTGLGDRSSNYIVWMAATGVHSWYDAKPGVRSPGSLGDALGVVAGISGGVSVRVPGLLLPDAVEGGTTLIAPERIEDAVDRGVSCFRVRGKTRKTPYTLSMGSQTLVVKDEVVTLLIDRSSFLLRKVEESRTFDSYRSESTTTYTPELDVDIPADQLTFVPPAPSH